MSTLLHLNGPSGVGKSTVASRWADEHPGTLDLDIDRLVPLIGGWRDGFFRTWELARSLALAMAAAHLAAGHDVVMPQMVNRVDEATRFEDVARTVGARYVEVALLAGPQAQSTRFRTKSRTSEIDRHIAGVLDDSALTRIHGHHTAYLEARPHALRVETEGFDANATYAAVRALIS